VAELCVEAVKEEGLGPSFTCTSMSVSAMDNDLEAIGHQCASELPIFGRGGTRQRRYRTSLAPYRIFSKSYGAITLAVIFRFALPMLRHQIIFERRPEWVAALDRLRPIAHRRSRPAKKERKERKFKHTSGCLEAKLRTGSQESVLRFWVFADGMDVG